MRGFWRSALRDLRHIRKGRFAIVEVYYTTIPQNSHLAGARNDGNAVTVPRLGGLREYSSFLAVLNPIFHSYHRYSIGKTGELLF